MSILDFCTSAEPQSLDCDSKTAGDSSSAPGLQGNTSWSDVRRYGARDSVSSVESDIAILASHSSKSNTALITQTSHEDMVILSTGGTQVTPSTSISVMAEHAGAKNILTDVSGADISQDGIHWTMDGKGQVTPVGSPLTNSVCSSMISSVYENTISGTVNETEINSEPVNGNTECAPVTLRNSGSQRRSRSPRNRHLQVYGENSNSLSASGSIYDSTDSSSQHYSATSLYDTASSSNVLNSTQDDSFVTKSHDSYMSRDHLSTNQSDSSSPLRRNKNARDNSSKRSAVYSDMDSDASEHSANIPDFPDDLSPIKRSGARKSTNRKAVVMDESCESEISQVTTGSSDPECSAGENKKGSHLLPWEQEESQHGKSKRDDSLNHEEFVNIDHR